jgi:hypothetical protein
MKADERAEQVVRDMRGKRQNAVTKDISQSKGYKSEIGGKRESKELA